MASNARQAHSPQSITRFPMAASLPRIAGSRQVHLTIRSASRIATLDEPDAINTRWTSQMPLVVAVPAVVSLTGKDLDLAVEPRQIRGVVFGQEPARPRVTNTGQDAGVHRGRTS